MKKKFEPTLREAYDCMANLKKKGYDVAFKGSKGKVKFDIGEKRR